MKLVQLAVQTPHMLFLKLTIRLWETNEVNPSPGLLPGGSFQDTAQRQAETSCLTDLRKRVLGV